MKTTFSDEQTAALAAFESAAESHDLHAFGSGRKYRAHRDVVVCFDRLTALGITDALTSRERSRYLNSKSFLGC